MRIKKLRRNVTTGNLDPLPDSCSYVSHTQTISNIPQGLLGTYLYVPVEVSEDYPGEEHTKPQKVKVNADAGYDRIKSIALFDQHIYDLSLIHI